MAEPEDRPSEALPPSVQAARKAPAGPRRREARRAYHPVADLHDPEALAAELAATQALLRAESTQEVFAIISTFVHDLGGALVPARYADPAMVLPVDVSLGQSEPLLPYADPVSVSSMRLRTALPGFLEVARLVQTRLLTGSRRDRELSYDPVTGVLTRLAWMRRLGLAGPGDSVCLIDLDHFKAVNDAGGHHAGDAVLGAVGALLVRSLSDACGRYGGDVFVGLATGVSGPALVRRCEQVRREWERERPQVAAAVGLSIGVADVDARGGRVALQAADAAMYRARSAGRDRTGLASSADYAGAARDEPASPSHAPTASA